MLEAIAVQLGSGWLLRSSRNRDCGLRTFSDNQADIVALSNGMGSSYKLNDISLKISAFLASGYAKLDIFYVKSVRNLADAPSRSFLIIRTVAIGVE